ncbi:MAG: hypothetical protein PHU56_04380 [Candidatus Pacebacteria bacterium]|nr:hypothetical protein [Candidatus Paceibacterota bacterium]
MEKNNRPGQEGLGDWGYEIPVSNGSLQYYYDDLWQPEDLFLGNNDVYLKGLKDFLEVSSKREGYVIDVGAGRSDFIVEINKLMVEKGVKPKGIRVDLQYGRKMGIKDKTDNLPEMKYIYENEPTDPYGYKFNLGDEALADTTSNEVSRAIAADALNLPFKDGVAQEILSDHLIRYFMENRQSQDFRDFMDYCKAIYLEKYLRMRLNSDRSRQNDSERQAMEAALERVIEKIDKMPPEPNLLYDLDLFEKFFSEISRVLKKGLQPMAEARLSPFYLPDFLRFDNKPSLNQKRAERFLEMVKNNFSRADFYQHHIDFGGVREDALREAELFSNKFNRMVNGLSKQCAKGIRNIFKLDKQIPTWGTLVFRK